MNKPLIDNNKTAQFTRSNEPIFWGLFSAGGMWAAIFSPIVIVIVAFIIPFGDVTTRSYLLKLIDTFAGKSFLVLMISLPIWCGLHRILHLLHDFNIHPRRGKLLTYSLAFAWSAHAVYLLFLR